MRPVSLRLSAFGAYPGTEVVDFTELAALGLFTVTGPTGAGKTTLFDALAYALYGRLPAGRPTDVVSHHADAEAGAACAVDLVFEVDGVRYRVVRTPTHERPKRRGSGTTTVAATAALSVVDADGERVLEANPQLVTERCQEVVGLTLSQFERVVLLPQGRFQQFLLSSTKERLPILQQLFGTQLYARAVDELKRRSDDLGRRVGEVEEQHRRHLGNARDRVAELVVALAPDVVLEPDADADMVEAVLDKVGPPLDELAEATAELTRTAQETSARAAAARATADRWDTRRRLLDARRRLDDQREAVEASARRLTTAERAAPVVEAADQAEDARRAEDRSRTAHQRTLDRLTDVLAQLDLVVPAAGPDGAVDLAAVTDALTRLEAELTALGDAFADLDRAEEGHRRAERAAAQAAAARRRSLADRDELASAVDQADRRRDELVPVAAEQRSLGVAVGPSAARVGRRRELVELEAGTGAVVAEADAASTAAREVMAAFVAGTAPRLAATLVEGDACPVCGATEHPAPAAEHDGTPVDADDLERAQTAERVALDRRNQLVARIAALRAELGPDAERAVSELESEHRALLARQQAAAGAAAELAELDERVGHQRDRLRRLGELDPELAEAEARTAAALQAAADGRAALRARLADRERAEVERRLGLVGRGRDLVADGRRSERDLDQRGGALQAAVAAVAEALERSAVADLATARADFLPQPERRSMAEAVEAWHAESRTVDGALTALADEDLPEARPDAEDLTAEAERLRRLEDDAANRVTRLRQNVDLARRGLALAREVMADSVGLLSSAETATRVWRTCNGDGPGRIGLETWVLAGELDRVTAAANVHLGRMTSGRYRLERTDQAGRGGRRAGLDLVVHDAHTGRERTPATLSGGEQFQAALALALGLADVVSHGGTGNGRVFEALFVDEGFGSLDPDALDLAVDALHQLRSTGRMVGVITHVEALKQQLPTGVEVRRRPDGGSTLAVGPAVRR